MLDEVTYIILFDMSQVSYFVHFLRLGQLNRKKITCIKNNLYFKHSINSFLEVMVNYIWVSKTSSLYGHTLIICLFVWFDSLCPINNLSVKEGRVFLG